ncbi:MAG TPA: COX15/CtaA family protein [Kocuria rosea]|jgi:cytochrome c oxidase assembly protein subunit 15|nr:COX15/CtaA family protein [Kocuria rosea]
MTRAHDPSDVDVPERGSRLLPARITPWVRWLAVASLVANALLVLTGGLVRLTGSGLGCPTWPRCTDESWTNTAEMGAHGMIEFGNRLLTFLLAAVAVLTFLAVWRLRARHRDLFRLALLLGLGIPLQAVVGGITVLTGLNPWLVGIHYLISGAMIALATVLVNRTRRYSLPAVRDAERPGQAYGHRRTVRALMAALGVLSTLVLYLGTLVTGTGPHAGDDTSVRHTFDAYLITRAHAVPVYLVVVTVVVGLVLARRQRWPAPVASALNAVLAVLVLQALIGYYQYFNGVPVVAVALHLVGSAVLVWAAARAVEKGFAVTGTPAPVLRAGDDARAAGAAAGR